MKIIVEGEAKEVAALVLGIQERQDLKQQMLTIFREEIAEDSQTFYDSKPCAHTHEAS